MSLDSARVGDGRHIVLSPGFLMEAGEDKDSLQHHCCEQ